MKLLVEEVVLPGRSGRQRVAREGAYVLGMQRRRLFTALGELALEHGLGSLTVSTICGRAGLSRKTFYSLYDQREAFLLAAFNDAVEQATGSVVRATAGIESWRDRIRAGLAALLAFLDQEPAAGRLLVVEALGMGEQTLDARRLVLAKITTIVEEGGNRAKLTLQQPSLTAEGVVGAVFSVIHARLLARDAARLVDLAGALTGMVIQPYLGAAAAKSELKRGTLVERSIVPRLPMDPFRDLPIRVTYRTARVLSAIAANPKASNRQIADMADIGDVGQMSKLLHRLERFELVKDSGIGPTKGLPRAWSLTERGEKLLHAVGQVSIDTRQRSGSS